VSLLAFKMGVILGATKLEGLTGRPAVSCFDEGIAKTLEWLAGERKANA
jgi:hypothetical protein